MAPAEQMIWALKLLPRSSLGESALSSLAPQDLEAPHVQSGGPVTADGTGRAEWNASPLRGLRFPPMSAAGPSGSRPEHVRDALNIRRRCVANRYLRLLGTFLEKAMAGSLPSTARWILGSQATFLDKPNSDVPRPIRAGEYLRRLVGKHIL